MNYQNLLGRPFEHGIQDCYTLARDFYRQNFDLHLADYARPNQWWENGLNLYMDNFRAEGFELVDDLRPRIGDAFLLAIHSEVPNHAAIYVGDGEIIHHLYGRLSRKELYRGAWSSMECARLRHPSVAAEEKIEYMPATDLLTDIQKRRLSND